jgi:opacity protein-like surface antigen
MKKIFKLTAILLCSSALAANVQADDLSADQRFIYIGGEAGFVTPVKKSFRHEDSGSDITLKNSTMYSAKLGYSFYPALSVELSATYHPTYKLGYKLPPTLGSVLQGKTKVNTATYMVNFVYDLHNSSMFTPFVIVGAGISRVIVKPTSSIHPLLGPGPAFRINKTVTNCFAWQGGVGVSTNVAQNFSIDLSAKLQVAHNIRAKYDTFATMQLASQKPIKKTIGVGEFGIGFTYKLPI